MGGSTPPGLPAGSGTGSEMDGSCAGTGEPSRLRMGLDRERRRSLEVSRRGTATSGARMADEVNVLEAALLEISSYLECRGIPYMVFGGFANLRWGRPRLTEDLDLKIRLVDSEWPRFIEQLGEQFRLLVANSLEFARDTRVVPIATSSGVRIDLVLAELA